MTTIGNWNSYEYSPNIKAPVILAFHGNGEAGAAANLLKNGFPQLLSSGWRPPKDVYIICPQDGWGSFPANQIPTLKNLIKAKFPLADTSEIYYTGYSAGGVTAWGAGAYGAKRLIPLSPAATDNNLVSTIAAKKIPVNFWAGALETNYKGVAEYAAYLLNQKVSGLAKVTIIPNQGHCCWNEIYKSQAFWDLIKVEPTNIPVNAGADQTIMLTDTLKLKGEASGKVVWRVMEKTVSGFINKDSTSLNVGLKFMAPNTYTVRLIASYGYDEMKVTVNAPKPPEVKEVTSIYINGVTYSLLDNGTVKRTTGKWTGASQVYIKFPCGDRWIEIDNRGMWKLK